MLHSDAMETIHDPSSSVIGRRNGVSVALRSLTSTGDDHDRLIPVVIMVRFTAKHSI